MNHTDECYSKQGHPLWYKKNDSHNSQDRGGQSDWNSTNICKGDFAFIETQLTQQTNIDVAFSSFTLEHMQKLLKIIQCTDNSSHGIY